MRSQLLKKAFVPRILSQVPGTCRYVSILSEATPNPDALVFWLEKGKSVLGDGSKSISFNDKYQCSQSPLAAALFKVQGVNSVLLGKLSMLSFVLPASSLLFEKCGRLFL